MDLRDYLRMLRRGAPLIVMLMLLGGVLSAIYLSATPKLYQSTAAVLVTPRTAETVGDLQTGNAYAESVASTIAELIRTPAVLDPVREEAPFLGADPTGGTGLAGSVSAVSTESSAIVVIVSSSTSAAGAAETANAIADTAVEVIPGIVASGVGSDGGNRAPLVELQVVQPAIESTSPASPNDRRILALFLVIGLALGVAIAIVRQALDSTLRRSEDVGAVTSVPILATVTRERRSKRSGVVVRDLPGSPAVEGYRGLRTIVSRLDSDPRRSLLVAAASADGSGAKVPANLGWSLASAGRRTLLIDLDLRHNEIGMVFGLNAGPGAAELLTGSAQVASVVQATSNPKLDVITSGTAELAPSDLLSDQWLEQLVQQAEQDYDYVVLHAPPLLSYTDAAVVARAAARTIVTIRTDHTAAPDLTSALGVLANIGVTPLGLVVTGAKSSVADNVRVRSGGEPQRGARRQRTPVRASADRADS